MATSTRSDATLRAISSLSEIARADWDACANPGWASALPLENCQPAKAEVAYNPFISYDFLEALEASGSATRKTGWLGQHLVLEGADGRPDGVLPCYLKSHSQGEYVFDHGWADAFERAGGQYYPKLQASVPFTPVTGRRLLARPGPDADTRRSLLAAGAAALTRQHGVSSLHMTFVTEEEWEILGAAGFLQRTGQQFHFVNEDYRDFDDFLGALASRKRKAIKRERRDALDGGLVVEHLIGSDLTESAWDAFFEFYMDTGSRKWGRPYLNRRFFSIVGERMADRILLIFARRGGRRVAGALNFIGSDTLYGRYWGTAEDQPFLHFELCYYQAIEWAIAHRLAFVEAGAQGEHKIARGYRPTTTYSAHWIANPSFRRAVADFLVHERRQVRDDGKLLADFMPFRKD
jgi:predicted N-acyltransferase